MKTILLSMPFGAIDRPALGISLLKSALVEKGFECDLAYPFENFVRHIGIENYKWLTDGVPYTCFAGDWCFTLPLYGRRPEKDWDYVQKILIETWAMSQSDIKRIIEVRETTPVFISECFASYDWSAYDVVGFTSTFTQNLASLAFAKVLKDHFPHLKIVFGGANWEDDMGAALFETFTFVDYVCRGEADDSFPALIDALSKNKPVTSVPGVLSRKGKGAPAQPVNRMDQLPIPDFSDFFSMHARTAPEEFPILLMETSRGCWWGAKNHCTFCGLNGQGMGFRSKSPNKVLDELTQFSQLYDVPFVSMVDNILDMKYFENLLPELAATPGMPAIFYETKANLTRKQIELLAKSKVLTIQPGIESLSNRVLKLMKKGTTGLRNIQLLKWCRELGISVEWNILYGFPGETDQDYKFMLKVLPALSHLQVPSGSGPVRFDRFSPYFETPESFGLKNLKPLPVFSYLYSLDEKTLARICCYFEADYQATQASPSTVEQITLAIRNWEAASNDTLSAHDAGNVLHITDTRGGNRIQYKLEGADRFIYLICDKVMSLPQIVEKLEDLEADSFRSEDVKDFLDRLVDRNLVVEEDGYYLSLCVFDRFPHGWEQRKPEYVLSAG